MSKKDDGGYVFQNYRGKNLSEEGVSGADPFATPPTINGITRRDWLAGLAMQGIVQGTMTASCNAIMEGLLRGKSEADSLKYAQFIRKTLLGEVGLDSLKIADAMIEEGKK